MSKTSSSRLTASRKKRRRPSGRTNKAVEALNGLAECHGKLAALAGLLEACGEPLEEGQVRGAGALVAGQTRRLEELTNTLEEETR